MCAATRIQCVLVLLLLFALLLPPAVWARDSRDGSGAVWIHLNGGDDLAYIGETNTVEIWIMNDATLVGMNLGFEFTILADYQFDPNHGGAGHYVQEHGRAVGAFDLYGLQELTAIDDLSPDSIMFGGPAMYNGLPAGPSELCYTMQFDITPGQEDVPDGFCIDNIFFPPAGSWVFVDDGGGYPPTYQGNPNSSENNPDAPPVFFDIVDRPNAPPTITNCPAVPLEADHCSGLAYAFEASDPDPGDLLSWTVVYGPGVIDASGLYYSGLLEAGSHNVEIEAADTSGAADTCWLTIAASNNPPIFTNSCTDTLSVEAGNTVVYDFDALDPDRCDYRTYELESVTPSPAGSLSVTDFGFFVFDSDTADAGGTFGVTVAVTDGYSYDYCQFWVVVVPPAVMEECLPGDADGNRIINVSDAVYLISYIFGGGAAPIPYWVCSGDADCNCVVNISDAVLLIAHIFGGGPPPCIYGTWIGACIGCEVISFNTPKNRTGCVTTPHGGRIDVRETFEMEARFKNLCFCCEYRQYLMGLTLVNNRPLRLQLPNGQVMSKLVMQEDGMANPPAGCNVFYGHRAEPANTIAATSDAYTNPNNRGTGCNYDGWDKPGIINVPANAAYYWWKLFQGQIIDVCKGAIVARKFWRVECTNLVKQPFFEPIHEVFVDGITIDDRQASLGVYLYPRDTLAVVASISNSAHSVPLDASDVDVTISGFTQISYPPPGALLETRLRGATSHALYDFDYPEGSPDIIHVYLTVGAETQDFWVDMAH